MPVSILWVEDEEYRVNRLGTLLIDELGCSITFVADGTDAVQHLYERNFSMVILDIMLPLGNGMDASIDPKKAGIEILRMIRNGKIKDRDIDRNMPVIILTAVSNMVDQESVRELSVNDYLLKPVRFAVFAQAVKTALSERLQKERRIAPLAIAEYEDQLDKLIANFDVESDLLSSPGDFLMRLAHVLDSKIAFIAVRNDYDGFLISHLYSEENELTVNTKIERADVLLKVVEECKPITINEQGNIDPDLRNVGITSMLAVPFPVLGTSGVLCACNRKSLLRFGTKYISYDVKICMMAFILSRGLEYQERIKSIEGFESMLMVDHLEQKWQEWFKTNSWILGTGLVRVIDERDIDTSNIADFLIQAYDGFLDIVEIKRPAGNQQFWAKSLDHGNYVPSTDLMKSITQASNYVYEVEREANSIKFLERVGNVKTVKPRCLLIYGRSYDWDEEQKEAYRILNAQYHNLTILTYDHVLDRARTILRGNIWQSQSAE